MNNSNTNNKVRRFEISATCEGPIKRFLSLFLLIYIYWPPLHLQMSQNNSNTNSQQKQGAANTGAGGKGKKGAASQAY